MSYLDPIFNTKLDLIDGVYSGAVKEKSEQEAELEFRKKIAESSFDDYLKEISRHHSIPVMDREVRKFLNKIPLDGIIVDVGGCWGWHWRNIDKVRPDVKVVIIDFVKENFTHAKKVLRPELFEKQIFLVHGDATNLPFKDEVFDGYWTVQTLQHILRFDRAVAESFRVLKKNALFKNYSLHNQNAVKFIRNIFGKEYHSKGEVFSTYYLERFSEKQYSTLSRIYGNQLKICYSEFFLLLSAQFRFSFPLLRLIGWLDACLTNHFTGLGFARQVSCEIRKK